MQKSLKIEFLALIVLLGFFSAVVFFYITGTYFSIPYPGNTFLYDPQVSRVFSDFYPIYGSAKNLDPYSIAPSSGGVYFPLTYIVYFFLAKMGVKVSLKVFLGIFTIGTCYFNNRYLTTTSFDNSNGLTQKIANIKNVIILSFLTYPFLFSFERANAECIIFLLIACFLGFYSNKRFWLSALFIALATAMKGYAGIFIFLFILDKRYKEVLYILAMIGGFTLVGLLIFKGSIKNQLFILLQNLQWFKSYFVASNISLEFNSSLYALLKALMHKVHHVVWDSAPPTSNAHMLAYSGLALLLLLAVFANLYFFETVFWRKVTVLTACCLLLPQISFDYHLMMIYLPIYVFVNESNDRWDWVYLTIFGLLLIPKSYCFIYGHYNINNALNVLLLIALIFCIFIQNTFGKRFMVSEYTKC